MNILILNDQEELSISIKSVEDAVVAILKFLSIKTDEISVCFVDRETICELHDVHFDDPSFTDCITFPIDNEEEAIGKHFLGEVIICPEAALKHVEEHGGAVYEELLLYLVHGICHLNGLDDIEDEERVQMRSEESRILKHLNSKGISLY